MPSVVVRTWCWRLLARFSGTPGGRTGPVGRFVSIMASHDANVRFVSRPPGTAAPSAWTWVPRRSRRWPSTPRATWWPGPGCPTGWAPRRPTPSSTTWPGPGAAGRGGPSPRCPPSSTAPPAGVVVTSMVPSITAVDRRGRAPAPRPPVRRRPGPATMPGGRGGGRPRTTRAGNGTRAGACWAGPSASSPGACGYWNCQAVATHALTGVPAVDAATATSFGGPVRQGRLGQGGPRRARRGRGPASGGGPDGQRLGLGARTADGVRRRFDRRLLRADRGRCQPARRRAGHLRGHPHRVGGDRGVEGRARPHAPCPTWWPVR